MRWSERLEWFLRILVFGSVPVVGALEAWSIWQSLHDYRALTLFALIFVAFFAAIVYLVRRRRLGMLETR